MGYNCYGRCAIFLAIALVMDVAGLTLLLVGGVGRPTVDGRPFKDFLMLTGGLLLFLSLLCWLFWYSGNLSGVPLEELSLGTPASCPEPRRQTSFLALAAKVSERLSQRRRPAPAPSLFSIPAKTPKLTASLRSDWPLEVRRHRTGVPVQSRTTEERLV